MRPRIVLDVTPTLYTQNGIGRCTRSLVDGLLTAETDFDFGLFGRRLTGAALDRWGPTTQSVRLRLPRSAERMIKAMGLVELSCGADLYHATDFYLPLKNARRAIATIHDVIFLRSPEPIVDHARLARWAGDFARECRAIITCSNWSKRDIVNVLDVDPDKVHAVYWGVDPVFQPTLDEQAARDGLRRQFGIARTYFLAVSCSEGRKNTIRLLRAYVRLLASGAENDLVVVWDPPPHIRQEFDSHVESGRIHFIGRVSDEQLRDLYSCATAMAYPSADEGFGLPMLEAMACGAPVVVSSASCLPEVAGEAAVYINPLDEEDIAGALTKFEERSVPIAELRERGIRRAAQFSWERCVNQTLDVYRAVIGDN